MTGYFIQAAIVIGFLLGPLANQRPRRRHASRRRPGTTVPRLTMISVLGSRRPALPSTASGWSSLLLSVGSRSGSTPGRLPCWRDHGGHGGCCLLMRVKRKGRPMAIRVTRTREAPRGSPLDDPHDNGSCARHRLHHPGAQREARRLGGTRANPERVARLT